MAGHKFFEEEALKAQQEDELRYEQQNTHEQNSQYEETYRETGQDEESENYE